MVNLSMIPRRTPKVMMPRMIQTTTKWPEQQSRPLSPSESVKYGGKFESMNQDLMNCALTSGESVSLLGDWRGSVLVVPHGESGGGPVLPHHHPTR